MNNHLKLSAVFILSTLVMACQSSPKNTTTSANTTSNKQLPTLTTQVTTRPVIKSQDGFQDIHWTITQIKYKKGLFFNQMPFLQLNSAQQRVQAHTGCNPIFGTYKMNFSQKTVNFDVKAAHMSCDNALSQEADLMDALAKTSYFQVNGKKMELMDQKKQILIHLEQR